jgi:hypothetical protein
MFTEHSLGDEITKDEMDWTCCTDWGEERWRQVLGGENRKKDTLEDLVMAGRMILKGILNG